MEEDQIIQICNRNLNFIKFIFLFFFFINIEKGYAQKILSNNTVKIENESLTAGNFLLWSFAEKQKDFKKIQEIISKTKRNLSDLNSLKKAFFSSLLIGDWAKAIYFAQKINSLEPKNLFVNLAISSDYYLNKNYNNAITHINKIRNQEFVNDFNDIIISWINLSESRDVNDLDYLKSEICSPIKCLHQALIFDFLKNKKKSKEKFDYLLQTEIESLRLSEIFLNFYLSIDDKKKVEKVIENIDENLSVLNKKAVNFKNLNSINKPSYGLAELYFNIAGWFYDKNMLEFSAYFSNISLKLRPNFTAQKLLLASIYEKLNLNNLALDTLKGIMKNNLYYLKAEKLKVQVFSKMQNDQSVLNTLEKLVKNFPQNRSLKILLAKSLHNQKRYSEAIIYYTKAIEQESKSENDNWDLYYSRGMSFERSKRWNEAESDLLKALEINPEAAYVLNYLGYSWLERGINFERALTLVTLASEILPNDAYITDSVGWAYFLLGDYEKSIDILEHALKILPSDPTLNDHLGDAYWKVGRKEEALSQWKRVLIFKSDYENKDKINKKIISGL